MVKIKFFSWYTEEQDFHFYLENNFTFYIFSLHSELDNMKEVVTKVEKGQTTDSLNRENKSVITSPMSPQAPQQNNNSRFNTKKEQRSGNTLYQELSYHVSFFNII